MRNITLLFLVSVLILSAFSCSDAGTEDGETSQDEIVPPDFKIAFIGDQGLRGGAKAVLELIKAEETDMVLHQGDFDYGNNAEAWIEQIDSILGPTFPYFASAGNHDELAWEDYQSALRARLSSINDATCTGDLGVNSACRYQGIFFILSGVGGPLGSNYISYLESKLSSSSAIWKICSWHRVQHLMQVGGKTSSSGWAAYKVCKSAGAIIATAHEHSYSRTHLMSSFINQHIASTSNVLTLTQGKSFAFVSGLGGYSIRPEVDDLGSNPWWASVYTADNNATYGALFCSFHVNGKENEAQCYFKNIDGDIIDSFSLISLINN